MKYFPLMDMKDILAKNIRSLMSKSHRLNTQTKLHLATKATDPATGEDVPGLTQSTIHRVVNAQVHATLDTVQRLADAFGVEPTLLLVDEAHNATSESETELLTLWRRLSDEDKDRVMGFISVAATPKKSSPNFYSREPIEPGMQAAIARASARPINKVIDSSETIKPQEYNTNDDAPDSATRPR